MAEGRPQPVTRRRLVQVGLNVVARDGFAALSAREVATVLGVSPMALYRHVPTMDQLRAEDADLALGDVTVPCREGDWRQRLRGLSVEVRRVLLHYPGLETQRAHGQNSRRVGEALTEILEDAGLGRVGATGAMHLLLGFLIGDVQISSTSRDRDDSAEATQESPTPHWAAASEPGQVSGWTPESLFVYSIDRVIAGLESEATEETR